MSARGPDVRAASEPALERLQAAFLVTCEHGGNRVPLPYRPFFADLQAELASHRGYDAGALTMARDLASAMNAPLVASTVSRLLIDLNRSLGHPKLYSEALREAAPAERTTAVKRYYQPYRRRAERLIAAAIDAGQRVIHISSHSFTPVLRGEIRQADIGLLYDPARPGETTLCRRWQAALKASLPDLRIRRNYPYAGRSDGFCTYLRRRFAADAYVGIELEINQKHVSGGGRAWRLLRQGVVAALLDALRGG